MAIAQKDYSALNGTVTVFAIVRKDYSFFVTIEASTVAGAAKHLVALDRDSLSRLRWRT